MIRLDDPELVSRQYETEAGLAVRRDAQRRYREGPDPFDAVLAAVSERRPRRVLEVGCGMGEFAERLTRETDAEVVATDLSLRMVELARARGLEARVADVRALPFADESFDCAVANAMLYHVDGVDHALDELSRVLERDGALVALTSSAHHMREVWELVGFDLPERPFSRENGDEHLRRHFRRIKREDVDATLVFPDAAAVHRYVASTFFAAEVPRPLPELEGALRAGVRTTVFLAER